MIPDISCDAPRRAITSRRDGEEHGCTVVDPLDAGCRRPGETTAGRSLRRGARHALGQTR
jgi:hypothetical protein